MKYKIYDPITKKYLQGFDGNIPIWDSEGTETVEWRAKSRAFLIHKHFPDMILEIQPSHVKSPEELTPISCD